MKMNKKATILVSSLLAVAVLSVTAAKAHHSFAMFDLNSTTVLTGVVTRVDPAPNHLQIQFAQMNDERKNVIRDEKGDPILWSIEMQGSAQMARAGLSVNSFPPGTVFSAGLHPLRNGDTAGFLEGGLFRCPDKTPPAQGMHCDSVEGHVLIGRGALAEPTSSD